MTEPFPADAEQVVEAPHEPVTVAGPHPDPAIAPNPDPDVDGTPDPAEARWVTFVGHGELVVAEVGRWVEGEVKHVAGWLAERLLPHPHFVEAEPPVAEPPLAAGGFIADPGAGDNVSTVLSGGDFVVFPGLTTAANAADQAEPVTAAEPVKPAAGRKRTTT